MGNYSWVPFYEELANKVLLYKSDKGKELADILRNAIRQASTKLTQNYEGFNVIDPFTFFAAFNQVKDDKRIKELDYFKKKINIQLDIPTGFDGVPTANSQKSWYSGKNESKDTTVLWNFFETAIYYADGKANDEDFINGFNDVLKIKNIALTKLTMGLFWLRPEFYLSVDKHIINYVNGLNSNLIRIGKKGTIKGKEYIDLLNKCKSLILDKGLNGINKMYELSYKAFNYKPEVPAIGQNNSKNIILYGPPGTGKTYSTIAYALSICCGDKTYEKYLEDLKSNRNEAISKYNNLRKNGRIEFVTFHQSYGYEDFIQGIKPTVDDDGGVTYNVEDGIFKDFCKNVIVKDKKSEAMVDNFEESWRELSKYIEDNEYYEFVGKRGGKFKFRTTKKGDSLLRFNDARFSITKDNLYRVYTHDDKDIKYRCYMKNILEFMKSNLNLKEYVKKNESSERLNYVFIIDEINRGNISKIFGELITLIEDDKRIGEVNETTVRLPNQNKDEDDFGVPSNIFIIGTMNTADRSIALLDTALRRRFKFVEMMPEYDILDGLEIEGVKIKEVAETINKRIEVLFDREHTIGHAYYLKLEKNSTIAGLADLFENQIIPLLKEYFYDDYDKIRYILGDNAKEEDYQFIIREEVTAKNLFNTNKDNESEVELDDEDLKAVYRINKDAFFEIEAYEGI